MSGVIPASGIDGLGLDGLGLDGLGLDGLELIRRPLVESRVDAPIDPPVDQGRWVADRLQLTVRTTEAHLGVPLTDLVGLAVRRNPRRAHLLVSAVLGKHVPADPRLVHATGRLLGLLAASTLSDRPDDVVFGDQFGEQFGPLLLAAVRAEPGAARALLAATYLVHPAGPDACVPLVLGYAETATALGHSVADALGAPYLHSTRRPVPGFDVHGSFQEEHSHATTHLLLPADQDLLHGDEPLVLVDDELSTGRTALNTIAELHAASPRSRYLIAALVDMRGPEDQQLAGQLAEQLGVRIDVVSLVSGQTDLPDDVLLRGQRVLAETADPQPVPAAQRAELVRCTAQWPADVREGGRHGFTVADGRKVSAVAVDIAEALLPELAGNDVLVLGFEELMYAPMRIGAELAELVGLIDQGTTVRFSSTTRSPVLPVDDPGYPVRTRIEFPAHDQPADGPVDGSPTRYAYNVAPAAGRPGFSDIVLVVDDAGAGPPLEAEGGLVDQLRNLCARVHLLVVPSGVRAGAGGFPKPLHGPDFGSFDEAEVTWLLTDLSAAELEAPLEEREEAVQSGRAHYAESLPVEYQPSAGYQQLFEDALNRSAGRVAQAVASVAEQVLQARGRNVVLVSLARAGTPIGILLRRWLLLRHDIEVPHYSVSIVRGKGIDETALGYLAAMHDPADVMFIDAWTGKGAIARELTAAVELANNRLGLAPGHRFDPELAVLADTGHCTSIFGTRDDFLIPSACLNATVHGLVSRTVLNDQWIRPGMFHGAKFYSELAGADRSAQFLTAVSAEFAGLGEVAVLAEGDLVHTAPTWAGWAAVERVRNEYGIADINLVKPGVGETTRVLLRRIPWKVLVRSGDQADLAHIRQLATERGVEIVEIDDLAYSCIGLIRPSGTATG